MADMMMDRAVLTEAVGPTRGAARIAKQAVLVILGIAALIMTAKLKIPMWPSPVPVTMSTFAVLTIGAAYGPRLGLVTMLGYLIIGAVGFDVFANSSAENSGIGYMMGGSGGYIVGWLLAVLALGAFARAGWDRSVVKTGAALLIGNALIYLPGIAWLYYGVVSGGFNAAEFSSPWARNPCMGPDTVPDRRCAEAGARGAAAARAVEGGGVRAPLNAALECRKSGGVAGAAPPLFVCPGHCLDVVRPRRASRPIPPARS